MRNGASRSIITSTSLAGRFGDLAVQREVHRRLIADVVDELVRPRVPAPFQARSDT